MAEPKLQPQHFRSAKEFRSWLTKNHKKSKGLWVGFQKSTYGPSEFKQKEAIDQALCFGWIYGAIKGIDHATYAMNFTPRKKGGTWSAGTIKRFKELKKLGLVHASGIEAFETRKKSAYENPKPAFSKSQEAQFKKNKKAWAFFTSQTQSYQNYMKLWVISAKRDETQAKRLQMLIEDSAQESKLKRVVEANERIKPKYAPGETPIEAAKNLGPKTGAELRSLGIETVEQLKSLGWERAIVRLCEMYPERINLNAIKAMIGAVEDQDWRRLDPELSAEAKALHSELKNSRLR